LLRPNCKRPGATTAAPAFCPRSIRRHELHLRSTKTRHINYAKSTRNLRASCWFRFLSDSCLAKDSAGPARRETSTASWQDKRRKVRRGRSCDSAETYRNFSRIAAHCKYPRSPLHSTGQHNVCLPDIGAHRSDAEPADARQGSRLTRARLRRLAALTGARWPGVCRPCADGSARAICCSRCDEQTCAVLWLESAFCEAPWLNKNLDRDDRGNSDRCPTISTTISGARFDEGEGPPRGSGPSGP
jgi:hypothetical protein